MTYRDTYNQIHLTSGQVNNKTGEISNPDPSSLDFAQVSPIPPWASMTTMNDATTEYSSPPATQHHFTLFIEKMAKKRWLQRRYI